MRLSGRRKRSAASLPGVRTCGTVVLVLARSRPEGSTLLTACASSLRRRADKAHCCTALIKSLRQLS